MFKPMLHKKDFITFQEKQPNSFEAADTGRTLDQLYENLADDATKGVMPTMLSPALKLEECLCVGEYRVQNALNNPDTKLWLKVLCAVHFGQDPDIKREQINLSDQAQTPMILRALQKTLTEHGSDGNTFTVFTHRKSDGTYAPIAFSFSNIKTYLCPAVNMNPTDFDDPWLNADDAVSYLKRIENQGNCQRMVDFLKYDEDGHNVSRKLDDGMCHVCRALCEKLERGVDFNSWFTDKLLCLSCPDSDQGVYAITNPDKKGPSKFILPLKRGCVDKPDALDAISDSVSGTKGENGITITFSYNNHEYSKTYTQADIICADTGYMLTNVAVWPNKKCAEWDRYFLYISSSVPKNKANPSTEQACKEIILNSYKASAYVNGSWSDPVEDRQGVERNIPNRSNPVETIDYVTEIKAYPEAISLTTQNGVEVGMLLPSQESLGNAVAGHAQLGIDFGTSNTLAYMRVNDQDTPTSLKIDDSRRILIHSEGDDVQNDMNFNFAPDTTNGEKLPFKTVVRKLPACDDGNANAFSTLIAPLDYPTNLSERVREHLNMDDDLKWPKTGTNKDMRGCARGYLEYLLLMWLWQVRKSQNITNINYVFTYPMSQDSSAYQRLIAKLIQKMPEKFQNRPVYKTESEVVFSFVNNTRTQAELAKAGCDINTQNGFLLMDIGGGSVDISLWQNNGQSAKLCTEVSLKDFAGNHMQVEQVRHGEVSRLELLKEIMNIPPETLNPEMTESDIPDDYMDEGRLYIAARDKTPASFRRLWNAEIDNLQKWLTDGNTRSSGRLLKRDAYVKQIECYFHYLFFFSGYLTGQAITAGVMEKRDGAFSVLLAGNGSRMYNLVDQVPQPFENINVKMFAAGMKFATKESDHGFTKIYIVPSVNYKHEVAFGAACSDQAAAAGAGTTGPETVDEADVDALVGLAGTQVNPKWLNEYPKTDRENLFNNASEYVQAFLSTLSGCWQEELIKAFFGDNTGGLWTKVCDNLKTNCTNNALSDSFTKLPEAIVGAFKLMENHVVALPATEDKKEKGE